MYIFIFIIGSYFKPSPAVNEICLKTEQFIRKLMFMTNNSLPGEDLVINIITQVSQQLIHKLDSMFPTNCSHNFNLLKSIIYCFCKIRIYNLGKKHTEQIQGDNIRKTYSKLILFSHQ